MPDVPILDHNGRVSGWLSVCDDYAPGDPPPTGYNDWHEWAAVQEKAGLRQQKCEVCGKFRYPQEIARTETQTTVVYRSKRDAIAGRNPQTLTRKVVICTACDLRAINKEPGR